MHSIATILTCHNRRDTTLSSLARLREQDFDRSKHEMRVVLMDDGSTDGTTAAVRSGFPEASVLQGDGSLFWCGGMRVAWREAAKNDPDYYLLLNDDTMLEPNAVAELMALVGPPESRRIGVAAIADPATGQINYGGVRGKFGLVPPAGSAIRCDTFNANAVLVSRAVYQELGVFHEAYTHAMGDFDYGYEATRRGIEVLQSGTMLGTCPRNSTQGTWRDAGLTRMERFKKLQSPKGLPWREWVVYNRRNAGFIWPWRCVSPFLRILLGK